MIEQKNSQSMESIIHTNNICTVVIYIDTENSDVKDGMNFTYLRQYFSLFRQICSAHFSCNRCLQKGQGLDERRKSPGIIQNIEKYGIEHIDILQFIILVTKGGNCITLKSVLKSKFAEIVSISTEQSSPFIGTRFSFQCSNWNVIQIFSKEIDRRNWRFSLLENTQLVWLRNWVKKIQFSGW